MFSLLFFVEYKWWLINNGHYLLFKSLINILHKSWYFPPDLTFWKCTILLNEALGIGNKFHKRGGRGWVVVTPLIYKTSCFWILKIKKERWKARLENSSPHILDKYWTFFYIVFCLKGLIKLESFKLYLPLPPQQSYRDINYISLGEAHLFTHKKNKIRQLKFLIKII